MGDDVYEFRFPLNSKVPTLFFKTPVERQLLDQTDKISSLKSTVKLLSNNAITQMKLSKHDDNQKDYKKTFKIIF